MNVKKISIVIGLYNSAKTINKVLDEIFEIFDDNDNYKVEIILVNDCGPDNVLEVVRARAMDDQRIKVIALAKNSGQTNAVMVGYRYATGDYIVEMDDDFQMPGTSIIPMIEELENKNYDVVFAKYPDKKESKFRILGSKVNSKMTELMIDKPKDIEINSFFVMRKFVRDEIIKYNNNFQYIYGIIFAVTRNVGNLLVEHRERTNGKSNQTLRGLLGLWLNGFLNFSIKPLRITTMLGVIITIISFLYAIYAVIVRLLYPTSVVGWTSIIVAIIFFAGVQLLGIGIIGEYLGRLYISMSNIPNSGIREEINIDEK